MANIKLTIDVANNIFNTLKQINSMAETVFKTVQNVKKTLNDVKSPNISNITNIGDSLNKNSSSLSSFFSSLWNNTKNSINVLNSLRKEIETLGGKGVQDAFKDAESGSMSFTESLKRIGKSFLSPTFLISVAIIGIILAIQELGKYMGWWTDWGSMIESFSAGIQRLWDAFINNPGVIAFIEKLKNAWADLLDFISPLTSALSDWWNSIFPPQSGEFDIVKAIIDIFGELSNVFNDFFTKNPFGQILSWISPLTILIFHFDEIKNALWECWNFINDQIKVNPLINILSWISPIGILLFHLKDLLQMFEALSLAWDEFVNSAEGQEIFKTLGQAFTELQKAASEILPALQELWNAIFPPESNSDGGASDAIKDIGSTVKEVNPYIDTAREVIGSFAWIIQNVVIPIIIGLIWFLQKMVDGLRAIAYVIQWVRDGLDWLAQQFQEFNQAIQNFPQTLEDIFNGFMEWLGRLQKEIFQFFSDLIESIFSFGQQGNDAGVNVGSNIFNGVISFIRNIGPQTISFILDMILGIMGLSGNSQSAGSQLGRSIMQGIIDIVKQIPGKIAEEIGRIPSILMSKLGEIGVAASKIGKSIYDNTIGKLKIFSPGIIAEKITEEFDRLPIIINGAVGPVTDAAYKVGYGISDGFGYPLLNMDTLYMNSLQIPTQNLENPINYSGAEDGFNTISGIISNTTGTINSALTNVGSTYSSLTSGIMESTPALEESNLLISDSFYSLENSVTNALNNIADSNSSNWDNINATTGSQLNNIYSSTATVTEQMSSAWSDMKSKITSAASSIQTQSMSHFNSLSKTIGNFYTNLQNPSRWGAGPALSTSKSSGSSGGRFSNIISSLKPFLNKTVGISSAIFNPCINTDCLEYTQVNKKSLLNVGDLIDDGCIKCGVSPSGAGWLDSVKSNFNQIKSMSNPWNMKGPMIANKYKTGLSFKVKDFLNGTPNIGFDSFKAIAESIFDQISYDFYFNSEKYGSWLNAFNAGHMNCSDSSDALIALAKTFGLPATKVHGHWGNVGHFWANIAGRKMDTTGWMLGKGWTPSKSRAGPAPQSSSINNIFESIYNILKNLFDLFKPNVSNIALDTSSGKLFNSTTGQTVNYGDTKVELKLENNFTVTNNGDNDLDEEKIAEIFSKKQEEFLNSSGFLDQLYKSINEKEARYARYGGV